ncbi:phosphoribosyl-AMP cyclohydrolase [Candidatus Uabimicrobium amorphum]|uniref:Phosphoribosyl-AMP cyclohydrolase n=1 Tax=Uabimicrobium amorphum TaxID=2596890 RepID=A0A5S9IJD2_UABAM|nr:phosphoribosyl-AMP cyclohydrolase [Candidatus Uabimicrobium amorphum]BBM82526.1 phosphoribosyl-AMP cyclohydrolase [Candidatus Uabimicrobium amorphum]
MLNPKSFSKHNIMSFAIVFFIALFLSGCANNNHIVRAESQSKSQEGFRYSSSCITEQEVVEAQKAWGEGIIKIGKAYSSNGDYVKAASEHINEYYGYDLSLVLFKPTLASHSQFRTSFDGALSYFVGGNPSYEEDKGFALRPWTKVRWENTGIVNNSCNVAIAMGNYYFTDVEGNETKVEYTLAYAKDENENLKIIVHNSSLPYTNGK